MISTTFSALIIEPTMIAESIVLTILTVGLALGVGLVLRRILVRRLKKTVLDNWIIQTLGMLVTLVPLIIAAFAIPLIWQPILLDAYRQAFIAQFSIKNIPIGAILRNLIGTLLLMVLGIGVARTLQKLTIGNLRENRIDVNIRTLIGRIFYFMVLVFTFFWILSIWNVSLTFPVAAVGVVTVAIGVSLQDILKDLVAGVYILAERPFHIGDQISTFTTMSYVGEVQDIQLRATKLRLVSGEEVTIPNSLVFGSIVVNNSYYGERRATLTATLPQEDFVQDETTRQILHAIQELEHVIEKPEPTIFISNYTPTTITLTIHFWVTLHKLSTVSDVMYTLHKTFPHAELVVKESAGDV